MSDYVAIAFTKISVIREHNKTGVLDFDIPVGEGRKETLELLDNLRRFDYKVEVINKTSAKVSWSDL